MDKAASQLFDLLGSNANLAVWGLGVNGQRLLTGLKELGHCGRLVLIDRQCKNIIAECLSPEDFATSSPLDAVVISTGPDHYQAIVRRLKGMGRSEPAILLFTRPRPGIGMRLAEHGLQDAFIDNFTAALDAMLQRRTLVSHQPLFFYVEPSRNCNLACVGCHPQGKRPIYPDLPVAYFNALLDQAAPSMAHISFFRGGEAFCHPNFFDLLSVAAARTAADIHISSNLSFRFTPAQLRQLATDCTMVDAAIDGLTPGTYTAYRRGGRFDLAFANMLRLARLRDTLQNDLLLRWRFVVFRHNEHEVPQAQEVARDVGVDLELVRPFVPDPSWLPTDQSLWRDPPVEDTNQPVPFDGLPCPWLYFGTIVNHDGSLSPCCELQQDWSPAGPPDMSAAFNSKAYRQARAAGVCPGCPPDRLAEWRNAFAKTVNSLAGVLQTNGRLTSEIDSLLMALRPDL